jgi:hypothetical protein
MKIGFVCFFPFRPHVENILYLSELLKKGGHETFFLDCRSGLPSCYNLEIKKSKNKIECLKCYLGGINGYCHTSQVTKLANTSSSNSRSLHGSVANSLVLSSLASIFRTETRDELENANKSAIADKLIESVIITHDITANWIIENGIEALVCFNGRMDITNAAIQACKTLNLPFITYESTWFGNGLSLMPNDNCLSLNEWDKMSSNYRKTPLTLKQASYAASIISKRILKQSNLEWRQYNINSKKDFKWTSNNDKCKVLILPSSRSEFVGSTGFESEWSVDFTKGFETIINYLNIPFDNCILRAHPVWGERLNGELGNNAESYYSHWCLDKTIHFIESNSSIDTFSLINQADIILINGSSAALEAGILGKKIICISPMLYQKAGFVCHINNSSEVSKISDWFQINSIDIVRNTLRFIYTASKRLPQFVDTIRGVQNWQNNYYEGGDPNVIIEIFKTGCLKPFDPEEALNSIEEDIVLESILSRKWNELSNFEHNENLGEEKVVLKKRPLFSKIHKLRNFFPKGDRL